MNRLQFIATSIAGIITPALPRNEDQIIPQSIKLKYPDFEEGQIKLEMREKDAYRDVQLNPPLIGEGENAVVDMFEYEHLLNESRGKIRIFIGAVGRFGGVMKYKSWISPHITPDEREATIKIMMGHVTADWIKQTMNTPTVQPNNP